MAVKFNSTTGRYEPISSTGGTSPLTSSYTGDYDKDINELLKYAQQSGINIPKEKVEIGPSLLNRVFGFLNAGETAPAAMAFVKGENPITAYGSSVAKRVTGSGMEGANYADVLKELGVPEGKLPIGSVRGGAGLIMDILGDPTTYIGAGLLKRFSKLVGGVGKGTAKAATKLPFIGEKIESKILKPAGEIKDVLGKAFVPYYDLKKLGKPGEQAADLLAKLPRNIRGTQTAEIEQMVNTILKNKPKTMDIDKYLSTLRESLEKLTTDGGTTNKSVTYLRDLLSGIGKKEQKAGVLDKMIGEGQMSLFGKNNKGYFPRELTKEGKEFFEKSVEPTVKRIKELGIKHGPEMERYFHPDKTVSEINKMYKTKIFEEDPIKAVAKRLSVGTQRTETANFFQKLADQADKVEFVSSKAKPGWTKMSDSVSGFKIPGLENVYVPKELHAELTKVSQTLSEDKTIKGVLGLYDKVLGYWKGSVTSKFPGFHVRNMYGGMFNNYILGVDNPLRYLQADKLAKGVDESIELGGKKYTYKKLKDILTRTGVTGEQGYFDVLGKPEDLTKKLFEKQGVKEKLGKLVPSTDWMNWIEDRLRGSLFIDRLAKGDTVDKAAKMVVKGHFDYAPEALTAFEREYMKRVIPFYRWIRGNIPFQFEQIAKQPAKYANIAKVLRTISGSPEEEQFLPDYMKRGFPIKLGKKGDTTSFLYGLGLPVEDIGRIEPSQMIQNLSPLLTLPIELMTKQNLYFGKPLAESNYVPDLIKNVMAKTPKPIRDFLDYNEYQTSSGKTVGRIDPAKWRILTAALGRYIYTIDKGSNLDTGSILDVLTGVKRKDINIEDEKSKRAREYMQKLGDYLYSRGIVSKFQKYYQPKVK